MHKFVFVAALAAVTMSSPLFALAATAPNTSNLGSLGTPEAASVTMVRELVQFTLPASLVAPAFDKKTKQLKVAAAPTVATFWLKNDDAKAVNQAVFLPLTFTDSTGTVRQYARNVRVTVNGAKLAAAANEMSYATVSANGLAEHSLEGKGFSFTAKLPAKTTSKIVITFDAPLGNNGSDISQTAVNYLFAAGAGWAGKIGLATMEFIYPQTAKAAWVVQQKAASNNGLPVASPKAVGRTVSFTYKDFEPTTDAVAKYLFLTPAQAKKTPLGKPKTAK